MPTLGKTKVSPSLISTGSLFQGTSSYAVTASFALNASGGGGGGLVQTGSIAKQTILYNVTSGSQNVITGLNLSSNKWGIDIKEEWDAKTITGDQYYNSCSLLLHCDGSNGSTTFTDNSPSPKTVTATNGAAISTAQSKFGGASALFDGTNDYVSIPDNEALEPGTSDLTWEMWIKTTSSVQYTTLYSRSPSLFSSGMWSLMINQASSTAGDIALYLGDFSDSSPLLLTTGISIRDDVWHHIAIVRIGSAWACYVDGISRATGTFSGGISNISSGPRIGSDQNYGRYFAGYIDEVRITKGIARYTSNFTPSTTQFLDSTGDANSNVVVNSTATGFAIGTGGINGAQLAKAWVNFDGIGTVSIRDSYSVSSITDLGTGTYDVNFSSTLSTIPTVVASTSNQTVNTNYGVNVNSHTTSKVQIYCTENGVTTDKGVVSVIVFRN